MRGKSVQETFTMSNGYTTKELEAAPAETVIMPEKATAANEGTESVPEATIDGSSMQDVDSQAQIGIQEIEATTLVWTKVTLALLFIW